MNAHSPIPPAILPDVSRQQMLDEIKHSATGAELKQRVMLARDLGWLSDEDAEDWIAMTGVRHD